MSQSPPWRRRHSSLCPGRAAVPSTGTGWCPSWSGRAGVLAVDLPNWPGATVSDRPTHRRRGSGTGARGPGRRVHGRLQRAARQRPTGSAGWCCSTRYPSARRDGRRLGENTDRARRLGRTTCAGPGPRRGFDPRTTFLHDIPPDVRPRSGVRDRGAVDSLFETPFTLSRWPDVPTTVLAAREDRLFPFDFQVRMARERLGIEVGSTARRTPVALASPSLWPSGCLPVRTEVSADALVVLGEVLDRGEPLLPRRALITQSPSPAVSGPSIETTSSPARRAARRLRRSAATGPPPRARSCG